MLVHSRRSTNEFHIPADMGMTRTPTSSCFTSALSEKRGRRESGFLVTYEWARSYFCPHCRISRSFMRPWGPLLLWALYLPQLSPCDEGGHQPSLTKCRPLAARAAAPAPSIPTPSAGPPLLSSFPELNRNWTVPSLPAGLLTCSGMPFHSLLGKLLLSSISSIVTSSVTSLPSVLSLPQHQP